MACQLQGAKPLLQLTLTVNNLQTGGYFVEIYMCQLISPSAAYMRQVNRASIGSDNGLSPIWHQAII